jgi:tetratricopeptide (TPR) repeat protein
MTLRLCLIGLLLSSISAFSQTAAELIAQGDALDARGKTASALKAYLQAAEMQPKDATLWVKVAKQQGESMCDVSSESAKLKLAEAALASAQKALDLSAKLADAHLAVAVCYGRLLSLVPARTKVEYSRLVKSYAESALKLNPRSDLAWHMLGRWHQACADVGGLTRGVVNLVYGGLPEASFEKAAECFTKAEKLAPQRLCHAIELGLTYVKMEEKQKAQAALQRGLALADRERDDAETRKRGMDALKDL